MAGPSTGGIRFVKCPKCYNVLPETPNVPFYRCGGCGISLRAKIRAGNRENGAAESARKDSGNYSERVSLSNALPSSENTQAAPNVGSTSSKMEESTRDGKKAVDERSHEIGGAALADKRASEARDIESKKDCNLDGGRSNSRMNSPTDSIHPNVNGIQRDFDKAENNTAEGSVENSETCRERNTGDAECSAHVNLHLSEGSKDALDLPDSEHRRTGEAEPVAQSNTFKSSEPLETKILKIVDELRGDLSELFGKSAEGKPRTRPPRLSKQERHASRVVMSSSLPPRAYHATVNPSVNAARASRSGQVAFRGLPSRRYLRRRTDSCCHNGHIRHCPHDDCCHHSRTDCSCRPPHCRSRTQEPRLAKPPVKETKRRQPRHHCRPILRGAPFVICSNCFQLVQLPADFVVSRKRVRKLQCGSCSEVLSYSYRDPNSKRPQPPSEIEHSTDDSDMNEISYAQYSDFPQGDPISYSEDYGLSFGVSYSTETEHPLYVSRNSSFNTLDERNGKEMRNSRLHRLMGYSSASELLRQSPGLDESFGRRTPNVRLCEETSARDRKGKGICK